MPTDFASLPRVNAGNLETEDPNKSILFTGFSGGGKTRSSLSAPGPIVTVYADANRETARDAAVLRKDIEIMPLTTWADYEDVFVPTVRNRKVEEYLGLDSVRTIVVDTISSLAGELVAETQGSRSALAIQDWGTILRKLSTTTRDLVNTTRPTKDHPGYNIIFNTHLNEKEDNGNLLGYKPAIMGQFAGKLPAFFDYVFLCEAQLVAENKTVDGKLKAVKVRQHKLYTVPPSHLYFCKGSSKLPPEIIIKDGEFVWDILSKYWDHKTPVAAG